ncbi:hypothetical protein KJA13_04005 [Patescibacteria group bacterium]|nr:hypothetical protein [Patescibacteria group bacterium]
MAEEPTSEEPTEEEIEAIEIKRMGALFSPEALVMFVVAGSLDLIGLILLILDFIGIGLALSFIPDIIGIIVIGGWMYFRSGHITISRRAGKTIKTTGRKIFKRLGLAFLGELIPLFGDIAFCWLLVVYLELKNN